MNAEAPLYSSFSDDPEMMELVELFVQEITDRIEQIDAAFHSNDAETLQDLTHQLKGAAGGYGFSVITDAAAKVEQPLNDGEPISSVGSDVEELLSLCRRVSL